MLISESHKEAGRAAKTSALNLPGTGIPPTLSASAPRIQMPFVHIPPPASFPSFLTPSSIVPPPQPPVLLPLAPLSTSLHQASPPPVPVNSVVKPNYNHATAASTAASTALLAARVAAAAVHSSSSTRSIPTYTPGVPLREVTNTALPSTSSQGPKSDPLMIPALPRPAVDMSWRERSQDNDAKIQLQSQMNDMKELDNEILELEGLLKRAANGFM